MITFFLTLKYVALYEKNPNISNFVLGHDDVLPHDIKNMIDQTIGCMMAAMGMWPLSSYKVPGGHYCFTNVASIAPGIAAAKKRQGKDYTV